MFPTQQAALEALVGRALTEQEVTDLDPHVQARRDGEIAAILSVGRKKLVNTEVGTGTILEVLGLGVGNTFIDLINSDTNFRHVKPLIEQGRLRLDSALVRGTVNSLVPALLSASQAAELLSKAEVADPISVLAVSSALNSI